VKYLVDLLEILSASNCFWDLSAFKIFVNVKWFLLRMVGLGVFSPYGRRKILMKNSLRNRRLQDWKNS
jgi:hypothetical protein